MCKKTHNKQRSLLVRKAKGCYNYSSKKQLENLQYTTCIGNFKSESVGYLIDLFLQYEKGNLPFPGTVSQQPNKIMDIFEVIDSIRSTKAKEKKNG